MTHTQIKVERENSLASNDLIDTIGVAGMMLKLKGRTIGQMVDYYKMMWPKVLVKWRDKGAIREATAPGSPFLSLSNE